MLLASKDNCGRDLGSNQGGLANQKSRTWGAAIRTMPQVLYPPRRRGTGLRFEDDGGGRSTIRRHGFEIGEPRQQKISLQDLYPPRRQETGLRKRTMGVDDHHGAQVEMPAAEKIALQVLYPPRRRGTGLRQKDDGGWWSVHHPTSWI
jgi:hypothetical protein